MVSDVTFLDLCWTWQLTTKCAFLIARLSLCKSPPVSLSKNKRIDAFVQVCCNCDCQQMDNYVTRWLWQKNKPKQWIKPPPNFLLPPPFHHDVLCLIQPWNSLKTKTLRHLSWDWKIACKMKWQMLSFLSNKGQRVCCCLQVLNLSQICCFFGMPSVERFRSNGKKINTVKVMDFWNGQTKTANSNLNAFHIILNFSVFAQFHLQEKKMSLCGCFPRFSYGNHQLFNNRTWSVENTTFFFRSFLCFAKNCEMICCCLVSSVSF